MVAGDLRHDNRPLELSSPEVIIASSPGLFLFLRLALL